LQYSDAEQKSKDFARIKRKLVPKCPVSFWQNENDLRWVKSFLFG